MVEKIRWENKDGRVHVSLEFNPEIIRTKLAIKNGGIAKTFVSGKDYKDYDEICSIFMYEENQRRYSSMGREKKGMVYFTRRFSYWR